MNPSETIDEDGGVVFLDTASYDSVGTPESKSEERFEMDMITTLLSFLGDRDRRILAHRFGLFENDELTLEEIGNIEGVSRERIRQLQNMALSKLKQKVKTYDLTWGQS